ncbi:MAG: hypothetical protein IPI63_08115 [Methanothrix sp.]|jgi:hypothetical protein|uniref:hypothetical protein n=2 Tax=Methanothrix sp. TaxID=90426 RepID=UPI0025FF0AEE|nr:hypothetical protein [Methanothrix sp.]MBK7386682.1 hypothetical protein [Methanothrix sp.]
MNYRINSRIIICIAGLITCLLAGFASGEGDFLQGGYVGSGDRSMADPGISGMLQWLDRPVSLPWYSSESSFYKQAAPDATFTPYKEYYTTLGSAGGSAAGSGIISNPAKYDIAGKSPSRVYYGSGTGLPFSQYSSSAQSQSSELWIHGESSWTQYVICPAGTWLQLIAHAPAGGTAGFYQMIQTDATTSRYSTYQFSPGYNSMNFQADAIGRHMLYFVIGSQPSNVVIVDVLAQA